MELIEFLEQLRSDHIARYEAAYFEQKDSHEEIFTEIAFEIGDGVFQNLYVADLVSRNAGNSGVIEVAAERKSYTGRVSQKFRSLIVEIERVTWDDMVFSLQPAPAVSTGFEIWFHKWLDLDATRQSSHEIFGEVIHSVRWDGANVSVDFGSSPVAAFMELMAVFEQSGVERIKVSGSRY